MPTVDIPAVVHRLHQLVHRGLEFLYAAAHRKVRDNEHFGHGVVPIPLAHAAAAPSTSQLIARDDEHFGHGVVHAVARNPRGSRLYFSSRIRREPRWRVCPENTILIHAQRKGTRARAFRGVAVSPLVSGG